MMDRITVVVDTREQEPYIFDSDKVSKDSCCEIILIYFAKHT